MIYEATARAMTTSRASPKVIFGLGLMGLGLLLFLRLLCLVLEPFLGPAFVG